MIKLLLLVLFLGAVISLFSGLFFLIRDRGQSFRLVNSLYLRVGFCVALLLILVWGFYSGELGSSAPWLQSR
ncbi:MAG: DUF2909 domain-containing protein [Marinobacterium sp.]|nr:DUF2909 domain-containing protein [Marinobacterium sp.]